MVTACTTIDAGRPEVARRLAAELAEHEPGSALSVLVLAGEERIVAGFRGEDFLVVSPADLHREAAGEPLLPAMLRMLLAQSDHVVLLDGVARLTGPLADIADAARAGGVLADAEGRLIALGRGAAAAALLDAWDAAGTVAPPLDGGAGASVVQLPGVPPWERGADAPPAVLGPEPPAALAAPGSGAAARGPRPGAPPFGVNLVGYLRAELGVAEVARQVIGALDTQDVPVLPIAIDPGSSRQGHAVGAIDHFVAPFGVDLLCVNADQTPNVVAAAGPDFFAGRYTIGLWWWEVSDFPEYFRSAFDAVDEVWAGSAFVADTLRAVSPKPVVQIPMPVVLPAGVAPARERFGFADDEVVFLYVFDYNSIVERKNPLGLLEAYRRAFPEAGAAGVASRPRLVLKCINNDRHPDAHARVLEAAGGRDDVTIIDAYLPAGDKDALLASCDAYVSLHRSEGFGLTCAEAMLLGKPVIATGYSGAADFMGPGHSLPVGWTMIPVGPGNEPYPADGEWADPDLDQAAAHLRAVAADPELRRELGARARAFVEREHSPEAAGAAIRARLELVSGLAPAAHPAVAPPAPALVRARAAVDAGPPAGTGPRWHPRRLARAVALRVTSPRAHHQRGVDRAIVAAAQQAIDGANATALAAARRAQVEAWQATAQSLREQRRLDARLGAVEQRLARGAAVAEG
jgi:glycosyltransferase involved in cell wall biosynthesis